MASARAMATRCFCPPESWDGRALIYGAMPTFVRYSMAVSSASLRLRLSAETCPAMQLLSADMLLNRLKFWNTMPTFVRYWMRLKSLAVMSCPW